jgi:hypothetical protein
MPPRAIHVIREFFGRSDFSGGSAVHLRFGRCLFDAQASTTETGTVS